MVHIRDVWVNWFEGEENGYNVCRFHEWRKGDQIEVLDEVILVQVCPELFDQIENQLVDLPEALLKEVHGQSYLRRGISRVEMDYCFIASDGRNAIVIDTMGYKTPMRKSRLTPKKEQMVIDKINGHSFTLFKRRRKEEKEYHLHSPHPNELYGLTRRERQLKQLLYMALDELATDGTDAEVRYWFTEWCPNEYVRIQLLKKEEAWEQLYNEVKEGWTKKHDQLCEALIKGHEFLERIWEIEQGESVNK